MPTRPWVGWSQSDLGLASYLFALSLPATLAEPSTFVMISNVGDEFLFLGRHFDP
jgi:hypothetical protein